MIAPSNRNYIPEEVNGRVGRRLEYLRKARGLHRGQIKAISEGTLLKYERTDATTIKLGDIYHYAQQLGMSPSEMLRYLADALDGESIIDDTPNLHTARMIQLIEALPEEYRGLACEIIAPLVNVLADEGDGGVPRANAISKAVALSFSKSTMTSPPKDASTRAAPS